MERFKETKLGILPEEWELIKSMDFCAKVTDGTHDTPKPQSDGFFLVTSKNLTDNGIDFSSCYHISKQDYEQINLRSKVEQYDVLFGMIGTVGNTTIVKQKEIDFAIKNVGLFKLNGNYEKALWLKYYFSSDIFYYYLRKQMAGTTQQFVGLGFLRKTPIIIPSNKFGEIDWKTIKSINFFLSKVDEAIKATRESIKAAEKLKKGLMQNLLTGKLKPDGTWRNEDEFYLDEKFGKVPKGWEIKALRNVFEVNKRSLPSQTEPNYKFKYITIESVSTEYIDFLSCPEYHFKDSPGRARRVIRNGDILISGVRPNLKAFAIYTNPDDGEWICSTGFYVLSAKENENHLFYFYQILSEIGEKQFHSWVAGSNYPAIGDRDIKNMKFYSPILSEQIEISKKINAIF
jgi:type I restriction enzyme S subunit